MLRLLPSLRRHHFASIKKFYMPDLGEKIKEATVKAWHVQEGDLVEEFQPVADVATDKLFTSIPSSHTGVIHKRFHEEDSECQVGELFLEIQVEDEEGQVEQVEKKEEEEEEEEVKEERSQERGSWRQSDVTVQSPAVMRLVSQHKVDLTQVTGSGPMGRILKGDVLAFLSTRPALEVSQVVSAVVVPPLRGLPAFNNQVVHMNPMERLQQEQASASLQIPHFYLMDEMDLTEAAKVAEGNGVCLESILLKAFSASLHEFPVLNSHYSLASPFHYSLLDSHDVNVHQAGLLSGVQDLSIAHLSQQLLHLRESVYTYRPGSISFNYLGDIGGTYAGPVVVSPQVVMAVVGSPRSSLRFQGGVSQERLLAHVSLGCDHRVLNGASVTRFVQKWKNYVESPYRLLTQMK